MKVKSIVIIWTAAPPVHRTPQGQSHDGIETKYATSFKLSAELFANSLPGYFIRGR